MKAKRKPKKRGRPKGPGKKLGYRTSTGERSFTDKMCGACGRDLPLKDFATRGKGVPHNLCQRCNTDHVFLILWRKRLTEHGRQWYEDQLERADNQLAMMRLVFNEGDDG